MRGKRRLLPPFTLGILCVVCSGLPASAGPILMQDAGQTDILQFRCNDVAGAGVTYSYPAANSNTQCVASDTGADSPSRHQLLAAGTLPAGHCVLNAAPGAGNTFTMQYRINGVDEASPTCVITGASDTSCDFSPSIPVAVTDNAGVTITITETGAGVDREGLKCAVQYDF